MNDKWNLCSNLHPALKNSSCTILKKVISISCDVRLWRPNFDKSLFSKGQQILLS